MNKIQKLQEFMVADFQHVEKIAGLIIKYLKKDISDGESLELMSWCDQSDANRQLFKRLSDNHAMEQQFKEAQGRDVAKDAGWEKILSAIRIREKAPPIIEQADRQNNPE